MAPGTSVDGETDLVIVRSAAVSIELVTEDELLPVSGSGVAEEMDALFSMSAPRANAASALPVSCSEVTEPTASVPSVQVTVDVTCTHPDGRMAKEIPAGIGSLIVADSAVEGPALVMVRV